MKRIDYFQNTGGLNLTDSPFIVGPNQATDGYNFEYIKTGAIRKRLGYTKINSSADTQLRSKGLGLYNPVSGSKAVLRASGTKLQTLDVSAGSFTNISDDAASSTTDIFTSSTQAVQFLPFNTPTKNMTVFSGGGLTIPYIYEGSTNKVTQVGTSVPTGTFSGVAGGSLGTIPTGTYYYALVLQKTTTGAESNAALDFSISVTLGQKVTITLPSVDQTKYSNFLIYRSAISGVTEFTTGSLVKTLATSNSSYVDDGTDETGIDNVPRSGGVIDNTVPEAGTYNYCAYYQNTLAIAKGSSVYFSDLNKPESFPVDKYVAIPSGGPITGMTVFSFSTQYQNSAEILVVFKQNEMWIIAGTGDLVDGIFDYELKFLDNVGCAAQSLIVNTGGFIAWIDYRGVYMWNGSGKAIYSSRALEPLFGNDGDIDKTKLASGFGVYFRKQNIIEWIISHKIYGENKFSLKLDLRLTSPQITQNLNNVINDAIIVPNKFNDAFYSGLTYIPSDTLDELYVTGDASGYTYKMYTVYGDSDADIDFSYSTKWLDQSTISVAKRYFKVVCYVEEVSDFDLTLTYHVNYSPFDSASSQVSASMGPSEPNASSIWDLSVWDVALWDQSLNKIKPIVFNLNPTNNASEGDSIRLTFSQSGANQPVVIHGFSIFFDEIAVRK